MILTTERLILRPWELTDAPDLFRYACDPDVGPIAGWPPHKSEAESRMIIQNVFNGKEAYAVCMKSDNRSIGAIELKLNGHTDMSDREDECELGYWIGKPFWGQGLITEAAQEILDAITNPNIEKVAVETIEKAAELTFKYSKPGDIILHMGPLIAYDRLTTVEKIMKGLEEGSKKYE